MTFGHPWVLIGLVVPVAVIAWLLATGRTRGLRWAVLSWMAVTALVVALSAPVIGSSRPAAVLAVDRSASIDASMNNAETQWIGHAAGSCVKPCRVVEFAAGAQSVPASSQVVQNHTPVGVAADDTDIAAGLRAAIAAAPAGGRVVVVTDGDQTAGDALNAVAAARIRGVSVDASVLKRQVVDAAITRVVAPSTVHQGDTVSLTITVKATARAPGQLLVSRDGGKPDSEVIQMRDGETPFTLSYTATTQGWHSFAVSVHLFNDQIPQNNKLAVVVHVDPPPRVLVVSSTTSQLAPLLQSKGLNVSVVTPQQLPSAAGSYAGIDAVELENVNAADVSAAQVGALDQAVRIGGLGVTAFGGPHSFSLGGYARSGIQRMLPVSSLIPGDLQRKNLALQLVLDRSGSMGDLSGGVPKIQMAQQAAIQSLNFVAKHRDEMGVVAFDIAPHVLLPMQRIATAGDRNAAAKKIDGLQADGGTDIYLGLQRGLAQILKSGSKNRHMILMTDGISQPHNYTKLLQLIAANHISVATVALGTDVDAALLKAIAKATGGNFYQTTNARDLPKIFIKETRLSAKPVQVRGDLQVRAVSSSPVVRSLTGKTLPGVTGNVVTQLKPGAQNDLVAKNGATTANPALAQWQYGTGRVVAWTPGLGAPWATAWLDQPDLWNDAARWVARPDASSTLPLTVTNGAATTMQLDLSSLGVISAAVIPAQITVGGTAEDFQLAASSPGIYVARLPQIAGGVYPLTLQIPGGSQQRLVAVPYPAEFVPQPDGPGVLGQVVTQTGGELLGPSQYGVLSTGGNALWPWLVALALLLFAISIAGRMIVRPQRSNLAPADEPAAEQVQA